jgi:hypothetical protein
MIAVTCFIGALLPIIHKNDYLLPDVQKMNHKASTSDIAESHHEDYGKSIVYDLVADGQITEWAADQLLKKWAIKR